MGYAISWIAFKDKTAQQVFELLSLSPSGTFAEEPEGMFSGAQLDTGWYLVFINEYGHKFIGKNSLQRVSMDREMDREMDSEVVAVAVEEHVMFSSAEAWKSGKLIWKVTHEGEGGPLGPRHLEEHGILPKEYQSTKQRLLAAQKQEDQNEPEVDHIFDIPLELAESIVGFKHDKVVNARFEILKLEILKPESGPGAGLLSRLFRKEKDRH